MTMTIDERNALVQANEGLARYWGRKFAKRLGEDDAMQEALLALVDASRRFDPSRAALDRFGAYAGPFVRGKLMRAVEALPRWTTETDLDAGGMESDDGLGMDSFEERERISGAVADDAAWSVRRALGVLNGVEREVVIDRLGLCGKPRLRWQAMRDKYGLGVGRLRRIFHRGRAVLAAALAIGLDERAAVA